MDETISKENYTLTVKKNYKNEKGYEFVVKGENISELAARAKAVEELIILADLEKEAKFATAHQIGLTAKDKA